MSLIVLTGLYFLLDFELTVPFLTIALRITINALRLWLVSWLSGFRVVGLKISGFLTFLLTAVIIWAFTVPARWPQHRQEALRRQHQMMQDMMEHDMMHHTQWTHPYY